MPVNVVTYRNRLTAPSPAAYDYFGSGVALSADSSVLVVGASGRNFGAIYTYDLSGGTYVQRGAVFEPSSPYAQFGKSVALSADGTILVVGDPGYGGSNYGGVTTYDFSGGAWVQRGSVLQAPVVASEGFGYAVALNAAGTVLVVGIPDSNIGGSSRGRVETYDWVTSAWVKRGADLVPADITNGDNFGFSVALSADGTVLAVVSKNWLATTLYKGGVYTFDVSGATWVQRGTPVDVSTTNYEFTHSVALSADGGKMFVGLGYEDWGATNDGVVWAFASSGGLWHWYDNPAFNTIDPGGNDYLGSAIAVSADGAVLVAASSVWEGTFTDQGTVLVYDMDYGTQLVGTLAGTAGLTGVFSNTALNDLLSTAAANDTTGTFSRVYRASSDYVSIASPVSSGVSLQTTETAAGADALDSVVFAMFSEVVGLADALASMSTMAAGLADAATIADVARQAINQIVADAAVGADALNLGAALALVDIANAVETQASTYNSTLLVAELIASIEMYNGADAYDVVESGALTDAYVARVQALVSLLETHYIQDVNTASVSVFQLADDRADGATEIASAGSLLNALLNDGALATIRLNVGGELFTGWVLNADTMAPSEYQFADLQFNSACKHGTRYLMAAEDGIYEFTDDAGVESVMTYIKTGKMDLGSDLRKSVTDAYMAYSASGQMALRVTTSEGGALQTHSYALVPFASAETPEPHRTPVGKGLKSRYWQFEIAGTDAGCVFDEIGMLPVVLTRRI